MTLPVRTLFESPTVSAMALVIAQHQAKQAEAADLERMLAELESLSEEQAAQRIGDQDLPSG